MIATTGAFAIYDKKTGGFLEEQSYQSTTEYYLSRLKEKQEKGEITLYCCCSNRIEMKVSKKPHLYPANRENRHSTNCVRHPQYEGTNDYEKAWGYDEEKGEYIVRVEAMIPSSKTQQLENPIKEGGEQKNKIYIKRGGTKRKGEATVHKNEIKNYIVEESHFTIPPITLVSYDELNFEPFVFGSTKQIKTKEELMSTLESCGSLAGMMQLPVDYEFECLDGNHRTVAIRELAQETPELIANSNMLLNIVYEKDRRKIRQDFVDINKNAKQTTPSINTLFNTRDPLSCIVMDILENSDYLESITELLSTSVSKNSKDIYTLNNI
ncbi:DNA sulfur modification protein DndB [Priestia endophytica]|uniref:ParB/Sulfiredoxin domain-containing protein n=1 Tax=Priestia endophytica TaxID=135735 RepID=A0AAX1Q7C7_9BACI|nr:DNA sulfur modification protein DndB [Priestia endophytica]RAS75192.1 hypothetical protein A3864_16110 [Priestia endophytica]RAS85548.1 hypothetical protein A3863_21760 [Priestia endophytica]